MKSFDLESFSPITSKFVFYSNSEFSKHAVVIVKNTAINILLQWQMACTHIHTIIGKFIIMKFNTNGVIWGDIGGCFLVLVGFNIISL